MHPISIAPLLIGPSTLLSTSLGQAGSAKGFEAALQVIENVLDVLGADGQADGALVNALVLELFQGLLGVRSGSRVDDEGLCVGHIGQQREQEQIVDEDASRILSALDIEGEDGACSVREVLLVQVVIRTARDGRVGDGLDFRHGLQVLDDLQSVLDVALDAQGNLLHNTTVYPHPPQGRAAEAAETLKSLAARHKAEAFAIGDGTAGRETEQLVRGLGLDGVEVFMVSEDGASVYSASAAAREEFPDYDVTVRGAVSIGRRLIDPLSELVKIDPKSIGVGQYQHSVDPAKLKARLRTVVESCVNRVGVNINTASKHILTYISGLGPVLAQNIVAYRAANGEFKSRRALLKVPRLGAKAFEQAAGFLRVVGGANPLDNSAVHPESYAVVERMAADAGVTVERLLTDKQLRSGLKAERYVSGETGLPTVTDILEALDKRGLDPREQLQVFAFDPNVHTIGDLREGMLLPGIVTNITAFGAFVDIGVKQDGLVHISQLADRYVASPADVVHLGQHVEVRVTGVDAVRGRIALSMRREA